MYGTSGSAFAWNEAGRQLPGAVTGDTEWVSEIAACRKCHRPVMLSVADGCETWAICLRGTSVGKMIHSTESDYEDRSVVAGSPDQFLNKGARRADPVDCASRCHLSVTFGDTVRSRILQTRWRRNQCHLNWCSRLSLQRRCPRPFEWLSESFNHGRASTGDKSGRDRRTRSRVRYWQVACIIRAVGARVMSETTIRS